MARTQDTVCIFDLDGTLVDSAPDLSAALNRILTEKGLAPIALEEVRPMVGEGARALLKLGYAHHGKPEPEGEALEALTQRYIASYHEKISENSYVFEGVADAIDQLRADGLRMAVCTNKTEFLAEPLLADLGLRDKFELVVGSDTTAERKPSPLPVRHIFERMGCKAGIMIGDTATDLKTANAAGIPALIATFGYGYGDPLLRSAHLFSHFSQLPEKVSDLLK